MINKKGFSLIEVLAVIVVLAIILVIVTPKVANLVYVGKLRAYNTMIDSVEVAAQNYALEFEFDLTRMSLDENSQKTITIQDLMDTGHLTMNITDPFTDEIISTNTEIIITKLKNYFLANFTYGDKITY